MQTSEPGAFRPFSFFTPDLLGEKPRLEMAFAGRVGVELKLDDASRMAQTRTQLLGVGRGVPKTIRIDPTKSGGFWTPKMVEVACRVLRLPIFRYFF